MQCKYRLLELCLRSVGETLVLADVIHNIYLHTAYFLQRVVKMGYKLVCGSLR